MITTKTNIGGRCYSCFVGEHSCTRSTLDCGCRRCDHPDFTETCGHCGVELLDLDCTCREAVKDRRIDYEIEMANARRKGEM